MGVNGQDLHRSDKLGIKFLLSIVEDLNGQCAIELLSDHLKQKIVPHYADLLCIIKSACVTLKMTSQKIYESLCSWNIAFIIF